MKLDFIPEPELEFGTGRHIDIRFGLMNYGPLDYHSPLAPKEIKLGVVGTPYTVEGVVRWLEACQGEIPAKQSNQPYLFPRFPGFRADNNWQSRVILDPRLHRTISPKEFEQLSACKNANQIVSEAANWFLKEFKYLDENHAIDVLICAAPMNLVHCMDRSEVEVHEDAAYRLDEHLRGDTRLDFHHLLKAKAMPIGKPVQIVLPMTYDESKRLPQKLRRSKARELQDEATRAWNIHAALYYKAKGVPWRLVRDPGQFTTCYIGVSFYQALDRSKVLTSVAEVFNERGEGMIVRGGTAKISKDDRQPHLNAEDAYQLLHRALAEYKEEHHTLPARVCVHKTSGFNPEERDGFNAAVRDHKVHSVEFVNMHESSIRLFRVGAYPTLRGTMLSLDDRSHIVYTRGSVDFFSTYPGMYVPLSLVFRLEAAEQTPTFHAQEILTLTKMNWNNTQFDGFEPITIRAARQVGKILKYVPDSDRIQGRYSFYM